MLPTVAIVGRPNVGKSSLFNHLVGYRMAIVEDTPGVTRDRIYADTEWTGASFTLIDTGGILFDEDNINDEVRHQVIIALEEADVILFMVDGRQGLTSMDEEVATLLRQSKKPVLVVVNKIDEAELESNLYEFYALGFDNAIAISAANALGIGELLDEVVQALPKRVELSDDGGTIKVAIVGKPNVGKSSLANKILGTERTIVSDIPGTTRDAIDSPFMYHGHKLVIIDTAGLRRKGKIEENIERYSVVRTLRAVDRCNIALIMIDGVEGVTEQDKRIAGYAHEQGKGCIIVVNKWDLVDKDHHTMHEHRTIVYSELPFLQYAPIIYISALTGQRVQRLLELVLYVSEQQSLRLSTSMINTLLEEATLMTPPPSDKGKRLKILYGTQGGIQPPTFILFVNNKELLHFSYQRFLENSFRKVYGFEGTPLRFIIRERRKERR